MGIPIHQSSIQISGEFIQGFEAFPFEGQGTQFLPPRFDQVQPASILGDELDMDFRPGNQGQFDLAADMDAQVILNQQSLVCRKLSDDFLDQLDITGVIPAGVNSRM